MSFWRTCFGVADFCFASCLAHIGMSCVAVAFWRGQFRHAKEPFHDAEVALLARQRATLHMQKCLFCEAVAALSWRLHGCRALEGDSPLHGSLAISAAVLAAENGWAPNAKPRMHTVICADAAKRGNGEFFLWADTHSRDNQVVLKIHKCLCLLPKLLLNLRLVCYFRGLITLLICDGE